MAGRLYGVAALAGIVVTMVCLPPALSLAQPREQPLFIAGIPQNISAQQPAPRAAADTLAPRAGRPVAVDTVDIEDLLNQVTGERVISNLSWSYSRYNSYGHRADFNTIVVSRSRRHLFELPVFPIALTRNDSFDNSTAVSLAPLLTLGLYGSTKANPEIAFTRSVILRSLLNARHHYVLFLETKRKRARENVMNAFSIFIKNNTDLFAGSHWWVNCSPGVGVNALVKGVQFQAGYTFNFEFSTNRAQTNPWLYATVGFVFLYE